MCGIAGIIRWQPAALQPDEIDRMTSAIIVRLLPGEVLGITWKKDYTEDNGPPSLPIEEIYITGPNGEIRLRGPRQIPDHRIRKLARRSRPSNVRGQMIPLGIHAFNGPIQLARCIHFLNVRQHHCGR